MGTYYNSRALEWFEQGRAELLRSLGKPYREMEQLGVMLPVVEAHIEFLGRAEYDDELRIHSIASMSGKARLRVDVDIEQAHDARPVCRGYTVHAVTNLLGKPVRPPEWLTAIVPPRDLP
jgi:acyl-CoA thioester hydrolase